MIRGTTPIIVLTIPVDLNKISKVRVYFMQGNKIVFVVDEAGCSIGEKDIRIHLTQEQTFLFNTKKRLDIRIRFVYSNDGLDYVCAAEPVFFEVIDTGDEEILERSIPDYIRIIEPPTKTEYYEGEIIDTTGMIVKAYFADGAEWGIVPLEELYCTPTTAVKEATGYTSDLFEGEVQGGVPPVERIYNNNPRTGEWYDGGSIGYANQYYDSFGKLRLGCGTASKEPFTQKRWKTWNADYPKEHNTDYYEASSFTYKNKTVYFVTWVANKGNNTVNVPLNEVDAGGDEIAWTLLWGTTYSDITVSWDRGSGVILSDSYNITVY